MDTPFPSLRSTGWQHNSRSVTPESRSDPFGEAFDSDDESAGHGASGSAPQSLINNCLDACAAAAGLQPGVSLPPAAQARVIATVSCLAEQMTGTRLNLAFLLADQESDSDDEDDYKGSSPPALHTLASVGLADLEALPAAAWSELDAHVRHETGQGITELALPATDDPSRLLRGLAGLPALRELEVTLPPGCESIDFGGLKPSHPDQLAITLHGNASDLAVIAPAGSHVKAVSQCVALQKSRVFYVDGSGRQMGTPKTLAGAVYYHTTDGMSQELSVKSKLNGDGRFGNITSTLMERPGDPIVCRTLSMLWLMARYQHHQDQRTQATAGIDTKSQQPFSYAFAATPQAISENVTSETVHEQEGIMIGSQADALFDTDGFGDMLSQQFQRMAPGDKRFFMASTPNHMLGVELQVKEAMHAGTLRREYVVNLYDPNKTTTHIRVVAHDAQWFESKSLGHWLERDDVNRYFPGDPKIGTLVRWIPPAERPASPSHAPAHEVDIHVDPPDQLTARFMSAAMSRGAPGSVTASARGILASDTTVGEKRLALRGNNIHNRPALEMACDRGQPATVAAYIRAVLEADTGVLPLHDQLNLLRARNNERPVLAFAAAQPAQSRAEDAIYSYVREIAASSLALADKEALLGETGRHGTAAQLALKIAPARVAAMMCAIHDANLPAEETRVLLASLQVRGEDMLKAMFAREDAQTELHEPMEKVKASEVLSRQATWMHRLGKAIRESAALDDKAPSMAPAIITHIPAQSPAGRARQALHEVVARVLTQRELSGIGRGAFSSTTDTATQALLDCLRNGNSALVFSELSVEHQNLVCALPSQGWQALHDYAQAAGGSGITRVVLPNNASIALDPDFTAQGLNTFQSLELLVMPRVPGMKFEGLSHQLGQLKIQMHDPKDPAGRSR
jgi:hypothetical protein